MIVKIMMKTVLTAVLMMVVVLLLVAWPIVLTFKYRDGGGLACRARAPGAVAAAADASTAAE